MEKLRQDIRANQFERVYLLYGEERYLVQMYKNQLKKAIIGDDEFESIYRKRSACTRGGKCGNDNAVFCRQTFGSARGYRVI